MRSASPPTPLDASSDGNESHDDLAPNKKRKPTYYVRKEEKATLEKELAELQDKIRVLEASHHMGAKVTLSQAITLNSLLSTGVETNNLALAGAQSMLSAEMVSRFRNPMDHYIYLPEDPALRRESLRSLHSLKLDAGYRLIQERMRYLGIRQPHRHCETTVLKNGDCVLTIFDVTPFDGYTDARVVFDQFLSSVMNQEISASEQLGIISIRETEEPAENVATQFRLLSTVVPGVDIESNLVTCSRFVDSNSQTYGLGTFDYVDKDDMYPYQSSTRVRKDVTACAFITETTPGPGDVDVEQGPGVSMARFASIRLHMPRFPLSKQELAAARANAEQWIDVMPKAMQERLGICNAIYQNDYR